MVRNALLLLISVCISFVIAEVMLRVFLPDPVVWIYPQDRYLPDDEIGHWLVANQSAYSHDKPVLTNSLGVRDTEYDPVPGPGVYRVLALGDSQTFGNGLQVEDTWPKQLEMTLNRPEGSGTFEVINCGLPASDTWQHRLIMERMLDSYDTSAVVLAFYVNDVVLKPERVSIDRSLDRSEIEQKLIYHAKRSVLLLSLRTAYKSIQQKFSPDPGIAMEDAIVHGESSPEIDARWLQVEQSLYEMKAIAMRKNIVFLLVSLPRRDQVDGRVPSDRYSDRLESIAVKLGIPFVNVLEPMRGAYDRHGSDLFISWDGHNTGLTNEIVAESVAAYLNSIIGGTETDGAGVVW